MGQDCEAVEQGASLEGVSAQGDGEWQRQLRKSDEVFLGSLWEIEGTREG